MIRRILLDNSSYSLRNMGDVAMLQVAAARLAKRFPNAIIHCLTADPQRLARLVPQARPVSCEGVRQWALTPILEGCPLPVMVHDRLYHRLETARRRGSSFIQTILGLLLGTRGEDDAPMRAYLSAVRDADLVVGTGGGYLTDPFEHQARMVLGTLAMAQSMNKLTAMVGQGVGPLRNSTLREYGAAVMNRLDLLTLRESASSQPLLDEMGVKSPYFDTTGDDAIEAVHRVRNDRMSNGIGVNLRVAGYAGALADQLHVFKTVLAERSTQLHAPLIPLPIALQAEDSDVSSIAQLMDADNWPTPDTPQEVMERVGQCRVVMTGSYHAAIFALSQGVPVVGIVASEYYTAKMRGIAGQFPGGCLIVPADQPDLAGRLHRAIESQWNAAPNLRQPLLESAGRQIELGRRAYDHLATLQPNHPAPAHRRGVWAKLFAERE
ncbi:MAG: polysaccharide pyruvyl transferase family protein [Phycisphaerales bacterium]|jgi:colanic acid/amylovoran biosynthesis protein|nr:polysaccharide pyruvyl transferase family protein [Phycisphaerales bacterium]